MDDNATPEPKPRRDYSRPTKYPAAIPRTMTTHEQRAAIDDIVSQGDDSIGFVVRELIDAGLKAIGYVPKS